MTRRITDQQWAVARQALTDTQSYTKASRASGIHRHQIARRYPGEAVRGSAAQITSQQWAVARDVLGAGFPVAEASKYSGISHSTLWQKFPHGHPKIKATIPAYYHAKHLLEVERTSYNEAEKTTGISSRALRRYFPGLGWEKAGSQGAEHNAMVRALEKVDAHYA